jgi:hypothetical protein
MPLAQARSERHENIARAGQERHITRSASIPGIRPSPTVSQNSSSEEGDLTIKIGRIGLTEEIRGLKLNDVGFARQAETPKLGITSV